MKYFLREKFRFIYTYSYIFNIFYSNINKIMKASVQKTTEICFVPIYPHPSGNQTNKQKDQDGMVRFCHSIKKQDYIGHEV